MIKFEYPYNFNYDELIYVQENCTGFNDVISFVYLPAFVQHSKSTREQLIPDTPRDIMTYERHIRGIQKIGLDIAVLFQDFDNAMPEITLKYYADLGIRHFIVNRDDTAETLKNMDPTFNVLCSITRCLTVDDIYNKNYPDCYDQIVLPFYFDNNLEAVETLPQPVDYSLFCNSTCTGTGDQVQEYCMNHWRENYDECCKLTLCDRSYKIPPEDLSKFEPYVKAFKLQGRETNFDQKMANVFPWISYVTGYEFDREDYVLYAAEHTGITRLD